MWSTTRSTRSVSSDKEVDIGRSVTTNTTGRAATTTSTSQITISSHNVDLPEYRSTISTRPGYNRSAYSGSTIGYGGIGSGARSLKMVKELGSSSVSGFGMSGFGQNAATTVRDARERERKEMSDLNDRLAVYIEKVRFLEAQNRKLAGDLDMLRGRWGKDTSTMRIMFESEIAEARKIIAESNRGREALEGEIGRIIVELAEYRNKYDEAVRIRLADRALIDTLLEKLCKLEAEITMLKRKIAALEEDVSKIKKENHRMIGELQRARTDLDQETLNRIDHQNQVQTLLEEIDFIRRVHDQEIKELQGMVSRDTTPENREYFKTELSSAIHDIRQEYDNRMANNRTDIESWYRLKVQEIQTASTRQSAEHGYAKEEVKRLRTQLSDLRQKLADLEGRNSLLEKQTQDLNYQLEDDQRSYEAQLNDRDGSIRKMREECQALIVELQMLLDTKQTLDSEIALYRSMLEGEESRSGLRTLVDQVVRTHAFTAQTELETSSVVTGESTSRTSFQRSAKGNVSIHDIDFEGKYITLENTHRATDENIGGFKLKRKFDSKYEIVYTIPQGFVIKAGQSVKVYGHGHGSNGPNSLVMEHEESWGSGLNSSAFLYNVAGEERATYIQQGGASL